MFYAFSIAIMVVLLLKVFSHFAGSSPKKRELAQSEIDSVLRFRAEEKSLRELLKDYRTSSLDYAAGYLEMIQRDYLRYMRESVNSGCPLDRELIEDVRTVLKTNKML